MALNLNNIGSGASAADREQAGDGESQPKTVKQQGNAASLQNRQESPIRGASASFDKTFEVKDRDEDSPAAVLHRSLAAQTAANTGVVSETNEGNLYSSHPVANYRVGKFRFEKGLLRLDDEDAAVFEKILEKLPPSERARVQKLDVGKAEAIVKQRLEAQRSATKNFDSTVGERASDAPGARVGTGRLGDESEAFTNQAQTDMNQPVHGDDPTKPLTTDDAAKQQGLPESE